MKGISHYVIIRRYNVLNLSQTYVSLQNVFFIKHKINMLKEEMVIKLITFTRHDIFTAQFILHIGKYLKCLTLHT